MTAVFDTVLLNPNSVPINNFSKREVFYGLYTAVNDPLKIIIFANYLKIGI